MNPAALLLILIASTSRASANVADILASARVASGISSSSGTWEATGRATIRGARGNFDLVFDSGTRFSSVIQGDLPEQDGFDGRNCWTEGASGMPHRCSNMGRDTSLLSMWVATGEWAGKAPITAQNVPGSAGEIALEVTPKGGVVTAKLILDGSTSLPKLLTYWTDSGDEVWSFSSYKSFEGRTIPTEVVHQVGPQEDRYEIGSVRRIDRTPTFQMPSAEGDRSSFDATAKSDIEVKFLFGYMFVHPKVDGQDVGWFFLDSGADAMCISPDVAKKLDLAIVGGETTAGAVAVSSLPICAAKEFSLGPVTIKRPVFYQLADLGPISKALGLQINGVCGYDFISRATLDIDPKQKTIHVAPPSTVTLPPHAKWLHIDFSTNTPMVQAAFPGGRGAFMLDTGSSETVDFCSPAVEKYHLLGAGNVKSSRTGGAGGFAESKQGSLAWFELAGKRFQNPRVGFQLSKKGAFASPYFIGNIGAGFMGKYRLIFDYQKQRIGFLPL